MDKVDKILLTSEHKKLWPAEYKQLLLDEYWNEKQQELLRVLFPGLLESVLLGATAGVDDVLALGVGVDWALVNDAAVAFAKTWVPQLSRQVSSTTRRFVTKEIVDWIESGQPLATLEKSLAQVFSRNRANMIAVTEVTRAFAEGNIVAWRESGVVKGKKWRTSIDEIVCPICEPLNNKIVELSSNGFTTETGGLGLSSPPAHVRCRCWLTPVLKL